MNSTTSLEIHTTGTSQTIIGQTFSITFSRVTGNVSTWLVNGHALLEPDPQTNAALSVSFWRPPTSNDMPFDLPEWRRFGIDNLASHLRSFHIARRSDGSVQITTKSFICTPILAWGFQATSLYTIAVDGTLTVSIQLKPEGPAPKTLPRMGLDLYLTDSLDNVTWFGRGPGESYADKKESQKMGIYKADTAQLHTPYEVPQENGNRLDTRWLRVADGRGWGLKAIRTAAGSINNSDSIHSAPFQWVASRYSAQMIENAKHPRDLIAEKAVRLRLDIASAGVGTGACGPRAFEKYQVPCEESVVSFCLQPCFDDSEI
jgi:beta-galactosidase